MLGVHGENKPIKKPWCVSSCDKRILKAFAEYQCDGSHEHEPAEGSQTKQYRILYREVCVSHSRVLVSTEMVHQCSSSQLSVSTCHTEPVKGSVVEKMTRQSRL